MFKLLPAVTQYWPGSVKRGMRDTDCGLDLKQGQEWTRYKMKTPKQNGLANRGQAITQI